MPPVLGIDLAAGRGITEVVVLRVDDGSHHPIFDAASHRQVATDDEIVAAVAAAHPAVLAIDAPLTLPRAVMRGLSSQMAPNRDADEQQRAERNTEMPVSADAGDNSPYTRAAERDLIWSTLGIRPLPVSFLGGLTFRAISLLPRLRTAAPEATIVEVFPSATLRRLDITQPAAGTKAAKTTEASRRIAQRGMREHIVGLAEPDVELYGADLLDALAAALTGVAYLRGAYCVVGDIEEGAIILPA